MRKLEADLFAISEVKEKHGVAAQQLSSQVAELKDKLDSRGVTDNRLVTEKLSIARQLESTNEQLVQLQHRLDTVEADNRRLMQDSYGLRQTNQMLNERVAAIIKRAAAAGDANKILSSRLMNAERERDAIRSLLQAEQQRANELEGVTQQVRTESILREIQASRRAAGVATTSSQSVSGGGLGEAYSMLSDDSELSSTVRK
jgi:chromosome segregation ATPase